MRRISTTSVADVCPHDVAEVEREGPSKAERDQVIEELTGSAVEDVLRA